MESGLDIVAGRKIFENYSHSLFLICNSKISVNEKLFLHNILFGSESN